MIDQHLGLLGPATGNEAHHCIDSLTACHIIEEEDTAGHICFSPVGVVPKRIHAPKGNT